MKKNLLFKLLAVLIVLITSAIQMRAASTVNGGEIYFDVSTSGWGTPSTVEYIISHDSYSCWYRMTSISNTKLYHISSASWGDAKYIAFTGDYGWTSCEGNSYDSRKGYGPSGSKRTAKNTYGVNSGSYYLFYASSSANDAAITTSSPAGYLGSGKTYTALNYTQTLNQTLSTDGGSTYSTSTTALATVKVSSYKLDGKTSSTSDEGTIASGSSSTSCEAARTATVTYTVSSVATGYEFVGWYDGSTQKSTSTTYTYTSTEAKTITARFKKKQYTVSYGVNSSTRWGSIQLNSETAITTTGSKALNHGTAIAFTATPNSGYQVEGWYSDAACSAGNRLQSGGTSYDAGTLTAAKTVYVKFEARTGGVITLNAGTGGQVSKDNSNWGSSATITGVTSAATKNIYARANTGYSFNTWTKNSGSGTITTNAASGVFTPVAYEDATVTASFSEVKSTITVTTATSSQGTLKFGSTSKSWGTTASLGVATTQEITATAADGFTFVRWDLSGAAASSSTLTNATITLKANGSGNTGTATAVFEEDLSSPWIVAGGNKIVTSGTTWRTTADADNTMLKKTGHSTESVVYFTVPVSTVCSGDNNGNFQFKIYNTSTSKWYGLSATGDSYYLLKAEDGTEKSLVQDNKNIELRAYVTGDYEFKLDYSTSTPKLTVTWPVYNQLRFYSARTGGTGTNTYDFSTASTPWTKTVNLTAGSTYWFKVVEDSEFFGNTGTMTRENCSGWTMSNTDENCGITPDFTGDYTFSYNPTTNLLSVTYPTAYTLTYDIGTVKGGNGSITSSPTTTSGSYVLSGNSVTLTAPNAKTGYTWKGWYLAADGSGTQQSSAKAYAVTMNADKTLYACYTENAYNVTVSAGAGGTVSPSGTVSVKQVSGTSITATPNTDFIFKDWTISGGGITPTTSSTSPQTFKATTTGGTITANFTNQWAICGIDDWETWNGLPKKTTNVYEGTVTLTAGNHSFKVVDRKNNAWYGKNSTTITRASSSVTGLSTSGNNITITADVPGTYTFNFNTNTKALTVTYPTAYKVTYDGNGKNDGSVPSASGTYYLPGTNVTVTNNSGYLYKTGYAFNGWNTAATPSGSSTHYDVGGTISSIGADVTLYAEWVANDYTMYFYNHYNNASWSSVYAYMWDANNDPEKAWHGRAMTSYQSNVYKIDYRHDVQAHVKFNDNSSIETGNLTIADGQTGDNWFYNPDDASVNTGGIHHGWSQYILAANYPTSTVAAVVGEKVTVVPTVVWADGINFADINITSTRASGSANINAVVSGTNIIVSGSEEGTATFNITYTYSTHTEATITKTLTVKVMNGLTIQAKIPSDDNHWVYSNIVKMHYWGGAGTNENPSFEGDVTMSWIKDVADGKYYQACVPVGTEATPKTNFIFFYDNFDNPWRQTQNITNVTANSCYTIKHDAGLDNQRNAVKEGTGLCNDSWSIQITMGSGDIYTSNIVETSDEIVSFFAPSNASESKSYRQGVVTIEHNGATVATVPANTFAASGVYTAKINTTTPALTNVALYTGDYYIRTDEATGGWDHYDESGKDNKLTKFTRNTKFPNESYSYYWVKNVAKTSEGDGDVNIKAVAANEYNPVLCNFSINEYISRSANGTNLRFGYEPTTNDLVRGILKGSTESDFLNIVGEDNNIFLHSNKDTCLNEAMYTEEVKRSTLKDVSNWVYLIDVYAEVADANSEADVVLKSNYNGVHYLLGMVKDNTGHETSTPITYPVIQKGTTPGMYRIRVVYDFKTNRLFGAWNPEDMDVTGTLNVDADVIFIRHEMGDVAQINITNAASKVDKIQQALFALEVENDQLKALGNRELHYWITLPFDCKVSNIFGIGGFMNYWGIQRYNGAKRAQIGWFKETDSFWEWLGTEETLQKGEGYLLSIDKYALQQGGQWREYGGKSQLTLYFPSTTNGFSITQATGADLTTTYAPLICTITREDRDLYDSNWRCIGTPGYKNITVASWDSIGDKYDPDSVPPRFLYEFHEQTTSAVYAQGTYTVTDGSAFTYRSFNSYLAQYAGTITWNPYSKGGNASAAPKRLPLAGETPTKAEIDLLGDDDELLDRAFVWLQEGATIGYDQNYDLNKIVQKKANQIYSLAEAGAPYAANILPFGTDTVQLVVNIVNEGEFTFSLNNDKHVGMAPVLYDMFKSEKVNLMTTDYVVELETGKYDDRFFLLFQPVQPIVTSFETTEDGGQKVHSGEAIYDVLGRRVNTIYPGHLYIVNGEKRIAK